MNLTNINTLMDNLLGLFKLPEIKSINIPKPLILASKTRNGLNAKEIGSEIIRRRAEAGLPVGVLPNGEVNPDEIMEIIRAEVILDAISTKAKTMVAIQPGIKVIGQGQTANGIPVFIQGMTSSIGSGSAIII